MVAALPVIGEQFALARDLHAHAADADDVGRRVERDLLDVLIDDFDMPVARTKCRDGRQPQRRIDGTLARQDRVDGPPEAPETVRQFRIDQQKTHVALHHVCQGADGVTQGATDEHRPVSAALRPEFTPVGHADVSFGIYLWGGIALTYECVLVRRG